MLRFVVPAGYAIFFALHIILLKKAREILDQDSLLVFQLLPFIVIAVPYALSTISNVQTDARGITLAVLSSLCALVMAYLLPLTVHISGIAASSQSIVTGPALAALYGIIVLGENLSIGQSVSLFGAFACISSFMYFSGGAH